MNTVGQLTRRFGFIAAAAGVAALLAGCGSKAAPPAAAPAKTASVAPSAGSTTPASSPSPAGPATCLSSDLQASLGQSQGAAGTIYQLLILTNTSGSGCTLYGYPGVSFVTGQGGSVIGSPAARNPLISDTLVTLQPGGTASALLGVVDTGALPQSKCDPGTADWLQIYPPGDTGSLFVQLSSSVCTKVGEIYMHVTAVHAGSSTSSF
ncbi:MAG TPA: DUF4232 domain-containing protein [Streptosporangiaceae bacterium]|nr:DUF4232 domain-containing protein [Streptosporangiaceae bacterium]